MRRLLIDLHKTDALLQANGWQYGHDTQEDACYAIVLERHHVTQAQFDSSLVWYTNHPQIFDKIYPKVVTQLEKEKDDFMALHADVLAPESPSENRRRQAQRDMEETKQSVDSIVWIMLHGGPSYWNQLPEPEPPTVPFL